MLNITSENVKVHNFNTLETAQIEANKAAANTSGALFPVVLFQQGKRTCLSGALPLSYIRNRLTTESVKKGGNVAEARGAMNRPLDESHAKAIGRYIAENRDSNYILPSIALNVQQKVDIYTIDVESTLRAAYLVIPMTAMLSITDGQHRQAGIRYAGETLSAEQLMRLDQDALAVMITCETDITQVHQDFADCSKTKALSKSQLAVYDRRNPANGLVLDLIDSCRLFKDKIDATSKTLSKKSLSLFLSNQVRQLVKELLVGSYAESDATFEKKAIELLGTRGSEKYHGVKNQFVAYVDKVTEAIPVLQDIAVLNPDLERNKIPVKRAEGWICLTATGLNLIGRIGHELFRDKHDNWESFVDKFSEIDWRRAAQIWDGNIIKDGKLLTQQVPLKAAVKEVRAVLGLAEKMSSIRAAG